MFIDDAFPDVTSIKNIKRVGELPMDGRTLRKKFNGGVYIKRGLQTPMLEALKGGWKLQEFIIISKMLYTVHLMDKIDTNFLD